MSYTLSGNNPFLYFVWRIYFDKKKCEWSDLTCSTVTEAGNGQWTTTDNNLFCILVYHNDVANSDTQPDLPSDLGHPEPPTSIYSDLEYFKWRIIKTSTFVSEPFQISTQTTSGDDFWRKVTPFELEIVEGDSLFCSEVPKLPSIANTALKFDNKDTYRQFTARWGCDNANEGLAYVSGPKYSGNVSSKGAGRWVYEGKAFSDAIYGIVFEIKWTSSVKGIGTSPNRLINNDVYDQLVEECLNSVDDGTVDPELPVVIPEFSVVEETEQMCPTFRLLFNCDDQTLGDVEFIGLNPVSDDEIQRNDRWEYFDTFSDNGVNKCVFYNMSSEVVDVNITKEEIAVTTPTTDGVPLLSCPCYISKSRSDIIEQADIMTLVVSGVVGESSEVNGLYELAKDSDSLSWKFSDDKIETNILYNNRWDISVIFEYSGGRKFSIKETIAQDDSFIGETKIEMSKVASFVDAEQEDVCALSVSSNLVDQFNESSSSTSSDSSSSESSSSTSSSTSSSSSSSV
jgi:hypothetical protein